MAQHHSRAPTESGRQGVAAHEAPAPEWGSSVLAVTLEVLQSVARGMPAEIAACRSLAREVGASLVAHVAVDPSAGTAGIVAWPRLPQQPGTERILDTLPVAVPHLVRLLAVARRAGPLSPEAALLGGQATVAAMLLEDLPGCREVAQVALDCPGPVVRLLVLGATGSFSPDTVHLLNCLRAPLSNLLCIAGRAPGQVAPGTPPAADLTPREVEVLRLIANGLLARTIALRLQVSPRTVHKHLGNIYRKLDAHDRLVAVRRAERLGLLAPPSAREPGKGQLMWSSSV